MPMREDCKHYQSRTYASGDTMRKCVLDLAPEAPWDCPQDCGRYEKRMADVNWRHGTLVTPPTPAPPASVGQDESVGALLDEAENIVNSVVSEVRAEVDLERSKQGGRFRRWWRFGR